MRYLVHSAIVLVLLCCPHVTTVADESPTDRPLRVAHVAIRTLLPEAPQPSGLLSTEPRNFRWYLERIRRAATDPDVRAIVIELRASALPLTRSQEIRRAVFDAQVAGKPVVGLLPSVATTGDYVALAGCDRVLMVEGGWLALTGVRTEVWFYKDLLDWIGVQATFVQAGEYKGAAEPFTRREMSPQLREQLSRVVDDLFDQVCLAVAGKRGCTLGEAAKLVENGPYTARRARELGLIDGIVAAPSLEAAISPAFDGASLEIVRDYGVARRTVPGGPCRNDAIDADVDGSCSQFGSFGEQAGCCGYLLHRSNCGGQVLDRSSRRCHHGGRNDR